MFNAEEWRTFLRGSVFIDEQFADDTNLTFLPYHCISSSRLMSSFILLFLATMFVGLQAPICVVYYALIGIRSLIWDSVILQLMGMPLSDGPLLTTIPGVGYADWMICSVKQSNQFDDSLQ
jgi:hypothetical protein